LATSSRKDHIVRIAMSADRKYVSREPESAQVLLEEVDVDLLAFVERYATPKDLSPKAVPGAWQG
jgi:hypothetical protein